MPPAILTLNGGSSSLKFALFAPQKPPKRLSSGRIERIGQPGTSLIIKDAEDKSGNPRTIDAPDLGAAADQLLEHLDNSVGLATLSAVGHRIVHGGANHTETQLVTPAILDALRELVPLDPEHLPGEIAVIEACERRMRQTPQIACFDTAFHSGLPRVAQLLPIPLRYAQAGIRRYGFHGLSYAYLMQELERLAGAREASGRVILAHLGNGASLAAVHNRQCRDTTMAFTPTAGLVMGTRTGDLDPGVLVHLSRTEKLNADALDELVNRHSGLLGLSEMSADVRDLLAHRESDPRARDAINVFCYQARKWTAAMAASLGGVQTLVFAGGIGENAPQIRSEICSALAFLGIELDDTRNQQNAAVISRDDSRCTIRVIRTDEESFMAHEVQRLLSAPNTS